MLQFNTSCPHQRSSHLDRLHRVSDHKPLAYTSIRKLLKMAAKGSPLLAAKVQCRLRQAIPGMVCPRYFDGPIEERATRLDVYFVNTFMVNPRGLGSHARAIHQIIKGEEIESRKADI